MRITQLDIALLSLAINGLKALNTLHYKSSFIERIAMVLSNEDARIRASDMSEMRVKSQMIQLKASKIWMSVFQLFSGSSHMFRSSHKKVTTSRFFSRI